jgi:cysteine desulfurase/selenocysteine lyase
MLDVEAIRRDFPILNRTVYGKPLVYLDNAATSQKPRQVIDALVQYYEGYNANIHRAIHRLGEEATSAYEEVRAKIATFINAPSPECIVFTRNTTEAINLLAYTWGRSNVGAGDEILLTEMEHHSNLVPWRRLAEEKGASVRYIGLTGEQRRLARHTATAPCSWWTVPKACPTCRWMCRPWTAISWPSPATRCSAPPVSACSTRGANCWRRWSRSWVAAR